MIYNENLLSTNNIGRNQNPSKFKIIDVKSIDPYGWNKILTVQFPDGSITTIRK